MDKSYRSTADLLVDIPILPIVTEIFQVGHLYISPKYNFLYTRKTKHEKEMSSPNKDILNKKIQIGMMEAMESISAPLDQSFEQLETIGIPYTAVLQISPMNQIYVSLANKTDLEKNLIESKKKDLLGAPEFDEEDQK
jgi:hypothetical protein